MKTSNTKRLWNSLQVHVPMNKNIHKRMKQLKGKRTYDELWEDMLKGFE